MSKNRDNLNFFKDSNGRWAIVQFPNPLLITWLFFMFILVASSDDSLKGGVQQLASALLLVWAYLEVTTGDSNFRKLLGGIVLLIVMYGYFN